MCRTRVSFLSRIQLFSISFSFFFFLFWLFFFLSEIRVDSSEGDGKRLGAGGEEAEGGKRKLGRSGVEVREA